MSDSKLFQNDCAVRGCNSSAANKTNVSFYKIPTSTSEIRNKWLSALKNKCSKIDLERSRICSKHFYSANFDAGRKLRNDAVPSLYPINSTTSAKAGSKTKIDRLLNRLSQPQLVNDINSTMQLIREPDNFSDCVDDNLQCVSGTPTEAQLWLLVRKQDHLITRLTQSVSHMKKQVQVLQKNDDEARSNKNFMENNLESMKYIVKCLQEKQASLEEQIEILTAVESR